MGIRWRDVGCEPMRSIKDQQGLALELAEVYV